MLRILLSVAASTVLLSSCASNPAEQFVYDAASEYAYELTKDTMTYVDQGVTNAVEDKLVELSEPPENVNSTETNRSPVTPSAEQSVQEKKEVERQLIHEKLAQIELDLFNLNNRIKEAIQLGQNFNTTISHFAELTENDILTTVDIASEAVLSNAKNQGSAFVDQASTQVLSNVREQSILLVDELILLLIERMPTAIDNFNELISSIMTMIAILVLVLFMVPFLMGWYMARVTVKTKHAK